MNADTVRTWLKQQPFQPFEFVMSNGERYRIDHPENAMLLQNRVVVAFDSRPDRKLPDQTAFLSYLHIAAIEPAAEKKAAS